MEEDGVAVEDADGCEKWTKKILTTPDGISRKTKKKKIEKKERKKIKKSMSVLENQLSVHGVGEKQYTWHDARCVMDN